MADPERPRDDLEDDEQRFEDEGRRSIFSALWFRAILVVVILGVVAAVAVPYVLELANQPSPKPTIAARPETASPPQPIAPPPPAPAVTPPAPAPAPAPPPTTEKPPTVERAPLAERAPAPAPVPAEKPATARKSESAVAKEQPAARQMTASATNAAAASRSAYFVQVGAFKSQDSAKKLATRLRELKYNVEESSMTGAKSDRRPAAAAGAAAPSASSDKYDVYVTGGAPTEINAKLGPKGLTSEPSAGGVIVRPSLPLRDAVALSKDLAVDGLKVQVRRASGGAAAAATPSTGGASASGDAVYRVRVGPFDDRESATSTLRELEQRGYTPFIARGGQ